MITTKALFTADGQDERSLEFLANAIERNNLPGFDYFEFKRAVFTLMQMQLDEATAQKSAFTTAATLGLTKDKLIETASYYHDVLIKEKDQFDKALENQNTQKIASPQAEIVRLKDQIERHKKEISRLQDEIGAYLNQIDQSEETVKLETEKLAKTKEGFNRTHQSVLLQIERDIESMHKNL